MRSSGGESSGRPADCARLLGLGHLRLYPLGCTRQELYLDGHSLPLCGGSLEPVAVIPEHVDLLQPVRAVEPQLPLAGTTGVQPETFRRL